MKAKQKEPDTNQNELTTRLTLESLQKRFPGITMLDVKQTAAALGLKNPQSIYNSLRKNAPHPFPIKPKRTCGKLYWNIVQIARYMAE